MWRCLIVQAAHRSGTRRSGLVDLGDGSAPTRQRQSSGSKRRERKPRSSASFRARHGIDPGNCGGLDQKTVARGGGHAPTTSSRVACRFPTWPQAGSCRAACPSVAKAVMEKGLKLAVLRETGEWLALPRRLIVGNAESTFVERTKKPPLIYPPRPPAFRQSPSRHRLRTSARQSGPAGARR